MNKITTKHRISALVTGAGQGIGAGIAVRLAQEGYRLGVLDKNLEACEATLEKIRAGGGEAIGIGADVTNEREVQAAFQKLAKAFGPPLVLVNNAGFARDGNLADMSVQNWEEVVDVHLKGAYFMTREAQPYMQEAKWGRIINISSISAKGHPGRANYCAAKAGLNGFTRSLAYELGPLGITVNAIAPGLIVTAMTTATARRKGISLEEHIREAEKAIPVRRVGQPEDIAHAAAFFASAQAGFINGQVLYVSGGPDK